MLFPFVYHLCLGYHSSVLHGPQHLFLLMLINELTLDCMDYKLRLSLLSCSKFPSMGLPSWLLDSFPFKTFFVAPWIIQSFFFFSLSLKFWMNAFFQKPRVCFCLLVCVCVCGELFVLFLNVGWHLGTKI